jgi:PAS domain S-box-containing protein
MNRPLLNVLDPQGSGALLSRLLAIADDAIIVTDDQQRIVLFNEGAGRIFGYSLPRVLGQPLHMLLPEDVRERHAVHLRAFGLAQRAARRMGERQDIQGLRADGRRFDAEASISHVELDGQTYFTAIVRDVSATRLSQRALADSESRFRGLAAAAPVGIFQADAAGHCQYVNERWTCISGMTGEESAGSGWLRGVHPADRAGVQQAWRAAVADRAPFELRFRFLRPDGSETWVVGSAVASHGADGQIDGHIGTVTDITDSHRQSQALERAMSEAESAARAKSLFLANMSHEIRTPLNAVIGMTTLLLDTPLNEDQRDFARTIKASSETLLEVINDILDYSKADVGKLEIEHLPFDLRRCVEESLDLVTPRALEKSLNLAYLIEEGTPESLLGDATRIRQVLVNLLSNAVKFTHQGEVFVSVEAQQLDTEDWQLRFAVKDTGIGIAQDELPRLFQSFTQVDASTTRKYGGTGLGLAISKRLSELMGGGVEVRSEPGHGSVFSFHVRVRQASGVEPADFLQRNVPALVGKRLLVVDDNLTNRRILTKLALMWGLEPSTFPSALEALDRVRHGERFDLAVLDMSMPEIDGIELALQIRRRRTASELPIVMLTSLGQRQSLHSGLEAGLAACLSKPIKVSQLFATLLAVVDGRLPAAADAAASPRPQRHVLRVLLAEDNLVNQRVARRLLQHLGYEPDLAADGRQVLAAVAQRPYDVVLMDIQMPELDGVEVARQIVRQRGVGGLPRIVAMTANAMPGDRETYLAAGMDGYLAKPIHLADLATVLDQVAILVRDSAACASEGVLDTQRLEHLRTMQDASQPSLVRELIDLFLGDSATQVMRITEAHAAGDAQALRALSHRFLSVTQNIGATQLSALCETLERQARAQDLPAALPLLPQLAHERDRAHAALLAARMRY